MVIITQNHKMLKDLAKIISLFNSLKVEKVRFTEISSALEMLSNKGSRMIRTLEPDGFFEKNLETGKYRLGLTFFELGMVSALNSPLRKIIRPHIERIAKALNLTVSRGILRDSKVVAISSGNTFSDEDSSAKKNKDEIKKGKSINKF